MLQFLHYVVISVLVSLVRDYLRGLRENLKHKIRTLMGCHVTRQVMPFPKIFTTNIALEPVTLTFFLITTNQKDNNLGV